MRHRLIGLIIGCSLLILPLAAASQRLQPDNFTYQGAFRLPNEFNWGALGLSCDTNAGTLLVTGFELLYDPHHPGESCWDPSWNCQAWYGEVDIPTPAVEANWEDLPQASLVTGMIPFDGGLASTVHREYLFVSDLEYLSRRGTQTADKVYGAINLWYPEGALGENSFPTIFMADKDGAHARGMFHVGPWESPYHGRKMGAYLFSVPQWYADQYLGGRLLMTGRSRGTPASFESVSTIAGSQGPTLFAFHPFTNDNPTGDLDALPVLYYRVKFPGCAGPNVGDPDECDYPGFTMCDDWTGGAFVESSSNQAIVLLGYKGLGENCYDEPPVECYDPCSQSHGYHCYPYERQVIFYDVEALGRSAQGGQDPWSVLPYTIWRPREFYLQGNTCWNAGGMSFDPVQARLYIVERGLGGDTNAAVVHVWEVYGDETLVTPDQESKLPRTPSLQANYPNPFNHATLIPFELSEYGPVLLVIYNLLGQPVRTLIDRLESSGIYQVNWDGLDDRGQELSSGIYLYRLQAGTFVQTRRMALLK